MTIAINTRASRKARADVLFALMQGWQDKLAKRRLYRRTVDELSALSDRELADLGINRSQIIETARGSVETD